MQIKVNGWAVIGKTDKGWDIYHDDTEEYEIYPTMEQAKKMVITDEGFNDKIVPVEITFDSSEE